MPANLGSNAAAILRVTLGTLLFSFVFASGKFVGDSVSPLQILFFRYVGGFMLLMVIVYCKKQGLRPYSSKKPSSHFVRAIFGCYGGVAVTYATANMPIVDATAIGLLQVPLLILLGMALLKERMTRQQFTGIAACSAGAVWIVASKGAFQTFSMAYLFPAGIALLGAVLIALEAILIRTLSQRESPMAVLLHVNFFGMILLAGPAAYVWAPVGWVTNAAFFLIGPLAITAQYFVILGYRQADVALLGAVDFSWLVFAALIGVIFFGEIPTPSTLAGSLVIIIGGIVLATVRTKGNTQVSSPKPEHNS